MKISFTPDTKPFHLLSLVSGLVVVDISFVRLTDSSIPAILQGMFYSWTVCLSSYRSCISIIDYLTRHFTSFYRLKLFRSTTLPLTLGIQVSKEINLLHTQVLSLSYRSFGRSKYGLVQDNYLNTIWLNCTILINGQCCLCLACWARFINS